MSIHETVNDSIKFDRPEGRLRVRGARRVFLFAVAAWGLAGTAFGQTPYPTKPIRLIVPQAVGGPSDVIGRLLGKKLSDMLGQPVLVDNRPGAGGNVGAEVVAKAAPDGHTLLLSIVGSLAINQTLYKKLPYALDRELASAGLVASSSLTLLAHPSLPARSVREVIALAKAKPNQYSVASPGNGTVMHVSIELMNSQANVKLAHIPYKGAAPALNDLLGGHVPMAFVGTPAAVPLIAQGKLVGLATTGAERSRLLPNLPTMAEAGLSGFEVENLYGIWVQAGTPRDVVMKLNAALTQIATSPDVMEQFAALGFDSRTSTPDQQTQLLKSEISKWAPIVKASGAVPD